MLPSVVARLLLTPQARDGRDAQGNLEDAVALLTKSTGEPTRTPSDATNNSSDDLALFPLSPGSAEQLF